jgi:carbamoyltransferase
MNSRCNGRLRTLTPFTHLFIGSAPDDSGTSVGAALWRHARRTGQRPAPAAGHNFWGTGYTDDECLEVVRRHRLPHAEQVVDPSARAAEDLARGRLIGWFQGRAEFGQRALGNRSILADPRDPHAREAVNRAVKFREPFRPFAPSILREFVHEWFDCESDADVPYMECVLPFRPDRAPLVPAVVHADGTGRVQTVGTDGWLRFRKLIEAFAAETGVPLVLNTSFNQDGEPIVNSPHDAIRTFYTCGLDVLYLGATRIAKTADEAPA